MNTDTPLSFDPYQRNNSLKTNRFPSLSRRDSFTKNVKKIIHMNLSNEHFDVKTLAKKTHLSVSQLNRKLNTIIHLSAGKLIRKIRMEYAATLLTQDVASVSDIAYEVGYVNPAHFCRSFKQVFGCSPTKYMKKTKKEPLAQKW